MADKKLGEIAVYEDDDGKAVWEFEGKVQSDIPLDTEAQDFAGAINELKKLSEQGGGEDWQPPAPWTRPSDWPAMPVPNDNQVIFLVSTARNSSPYCSITTRPLDQYAFPENKGEYPEGLTISINWGDGHTSAAVYRTTKTLEWTNQFGQNGPNANNPATDGNAANYYYDYTGDYSNRERFWNPGGTKLNDGTVVFIVTVTVSDPDNVVICWPRNSDTFEAYIGKNINIDINGGGYDSARHLQHVKAFGWQPKKNKDKQYSFYNSNTGAISWNTNGLFGNNANLRKIEATEPFTEIPDNMFKEIRISIEIDLSKVTKIGENAFGNTNFFKSDLELPECMEIGKSAFRQCTGVFTLNAPALVSAGEGAFQYCYNLRKVDAVNLESVSADTFENCQSLYKVNIPKAKFVSADGFQWCYTLTEVNAPLLEVLGNNAFKGCFSLNELIAPELRSVGQNAFSDCYALKKLVCAEGTDLSKAGLGASYLWYDNPALQQYRPKDIN